MTFIFEGRRSDSPFVETVWRTRSDGVGGSFISTAATHWEMVVTRQYGLLTCTMHGPETKATPAPIPEDAEFFGIVFTLGTFMPALPVGQFVDRAIYLPEAARRSFWLHGSAWQFPTFDNADTFVERLVRQGLLTHDPLVGAALHGHLRGPSPRSVQRRFLRATGLTQGAVCQIQRARHAVDLLQQGVSIADTVERAGYADQPHLTRSLRRFVGHTPAQLFAPSGSR